MSEIILTTIGGGNEIGANCYLLSAGGCQLVLDCGVHPKKEGKEALPEFSLLSGAPEAVVISHGHIDHCGAAPHLARRFRSISCFATKPTARVMDRMLHNSVSVMENIALERGIQDYPLYTHEDVDFLLARTYGLGIEQPFSPHGKSPFRISLHHAGHVLGGASILVEAPGHTVFYTGDTCSADQELISGRTPLNHGVEVDSLVIECTRGASLDGDRITFEGEVDRFAEEVSAVLRNRGSVLVPCFALGRTQELLNVIVRLQDDGRLPEVPIYASGLGRAVYEIYSGFPTYLRPGATLCPLHWFKRIGDVWDPGVTRRLLKKDSIIVATSGMMVENTPSALIAAEMVRENRHGIFFVGYLDPDSLGYKLLHAQMGDGLCFEWGGRPVEIRLENRQSFHFSAHASRADLQALITEVRPKNVVFVHGDPEAIAWMRENCDGACRKFAPAIGEAVSLPA